MRIHGLSGDLENGRAYPAAKSERGLTRSAQKAGSGAAQRVMATCGQHAPEVKAGHEGRSDRRGSRGKPSGHRERYLGYQPLFGYCQSIRPGGVSAHHPSAQVSAGRHRITGAVQLVLLVSPDRKELHQVAQAASARAGPPAKPDSPLGRRAAKRRVDAQGAAALPGPEHRVQFPR